MPFPLWVAASASTVLCLILLVLWRSAAWGAALGAKPAGGRLARMQSSPHWSSNRFENLEATTMMHKSAMVRTLPKFFFRRANRRPRLPLPHFAKASALALLGQRPQSGLRITWLGHSTVLLELDGTRLLFDPMFAERASPSDLLGTKRFSPPALSLAELPPLDAVILSHDHYDHLDMHAIQALSRLHVPFFAPLGVGAHLEQWGVAASRIIECDWWQEVTISTLRLVSTPAKHFSGRSVTDRNGTLWCSWSILGQTRRVFFGADSGPNQAFSDIGRRLGPFDLALLEIGAWDPAWGEIHMGPREALRAFQQIGANFFLPIHWATFNLAVHDWFEPAETLLRSGAQYEARILTPLLGQPLEPFAPAPASAVTDRWWRPLSAAEPGR